MRHEEQPDEELTGEDLRNNKADEDEVVEEDDGLDHSWDDVIPLAANISGGGIRIMLHHQFAEGDLVPVEIYVPLESGPKIIDAVCKVVFPERILLQKNSSTVPLTIPVCNFYGLTSGNGMRWLLTYPTCS